MIDSAESQLRNALGARPFRWYAQLGSTYDAARDWIAEQPNVAQGALVITDEQTAGRGRFARQWQAPPGSALLFTVIVRDYPGRWARLPLLGALAVAETLESLTPTPERIRLKWPNDVQIDGRKVAGILAESEWHGGQPVAALLGIGLNVNIDFDSTDLATRATSIEPALGIGVDRFQVLADLLHRIDFWTARLDEPALIDAWRSRLVTLGQRVTARSGGSADAAAPISGLAYAVDSDGALLIRDDLNQSHRLVAGEVTLREPPSNA